MEKQRCVFKVSSGQVVAKLEGNGKKELLRQFVSYCSSAFNQLKPIENRNFYGRLIYSDGKTYYFMEFEDDTCKPTVSETYLDSFTSKSYGVKRTEDLTSTHYFKVNYLFLLRETLQEVFSKVPSGRIQFKGIIATPSDASFVFIIQTLTFHVSIFCKEGYDYQITIKVNNEPLVSSVSVLH